MLLSLVFAVALAPLAAAQNLQNVLAEAGVLGRWANDCRRPPGGGNIHTTYAADAAGEVTLRYDHGAGYTPTVNTILSARQIAPDRLAYEQVNKSNGARLSIVLMITATHIRVWSSQRNTGQVLVANGKFVSDGADSPLQARCS
jgi:hypothetical protein